MSARARSTPPRRRAQGGFTLIEVLIALVVIALGLLGFAMVQTLSVRYTQSANLRTQATNLAYDLLDQVRANRWQSPQYTAINRASFGSVSGSNCSRPVAAVSPAASMERWRCQVRAALGSQAYADVVQNGMRMTVTISWSDANGEVGEVGANSNGRVTLETQL